MLRAPIVRLVELSTRFAWAVILFAIVLASFCTVYAAQHFSISTDVTRLFPADLPWTQRATRFLSAFPQYDVLVIVEAPTAELTEAASARLAPALKADRDHVRAVEEPQGDRFFARNGLLFVPVKQLAQMTVNAQQAGPLVGPLAADPSLRGVLGALSEGLMGVENGLFGIDSLAPAMNAGADTINDVLSQRPAHFSWQSLTGGGMTPNAANHRFIQIAPVLDFKALSPGGAVTRAISQTARRLHLADDFQARVRVTGLVPMNDAQFAAVKENAALNGAVFIGAMLIILWFALHSWRIIVAALVSVTCGLTYSAAFGLFLVSSLNLLSVAFFVLFVGLGIDFGIQFSVRYRAERHETHDLSAALLSAARKAGWPLALAGAATALGFSAFLPTEYRGLSELGRIAGPGMIIAFLTSITLLPALLQVLNPPAEHRPMGFIALAPVDRFLQRNRYAVLVGTLTVVAVASPLLFFLRFDFNPLHLQNPKADSVAAFLELRRDPLTAANAAELIAPDLAEAKADAKSLAALPQVAGTRTLASLVPGDQQFKLALIRQLSAALAPALTPARLRPAPSDRENIAVLRSTARTLSEYAARSGAGGKAAKRLSALLDRLAAADPDARMRATVAMIVPLKITLEGLRQELTARPVALADVPQDLKRDWLTPDGRARVQVLPRSDPDDTASLRNFVRAVLAREPNATGPAIMLYEAGNTIMHAFIEAGILALVAIALLLWIALRRLSDVLMTLIPLLLAAVLTLELCVLLNIPLNFSNIIAFPLLLGVGVAFKIYYIMAWRRGLTALVQSTLTRAVMFSAMTTATAFGSLWLSRHPGTSSMGELMSLSLLCTMLAAVLFQPALMGPPRKTAVEKQPGKPAAVRGPPVMAACAMESLDERP